MPAADREIQIFLQPTERIAIDMGAVGPSIGDAASARGTVNRTRNGPEIGHYMWSGTTVAVEADGERETRNSTFRISLEDGDIYLLGMHEARAGGLPDQVMRFIVAGGDGVYTGAAGSATLLPVENGYEVDMRLVSHGS